MIIEGDKILQRLADKQFEILGEKMRFSDIPDNGLVQNGKKKDEWYKVYKFTEDQYEGWKKFAIEELRTVCADDTHVEEVFRGLDMLYGFVIRYTKKGQLF